jgi:crotonobetainyl-CoA:carnitine CoA-transferase CaiB-like acyl-CoA transferase
MVATARRFSEIDSGPQIIWEKRSLQEFALGMLQTVRRRSGTVYQTTRCPIRIAGQRLYSEKGSPDIGEDTNRITTELIA